MFEFFFTAQDHTRPNDDTYGLRKVSENADMPDSEVAADGVAEGNPHNKVAADIRRVVVEVADNQRLRGHRRHPRCPAAVHLPRQILDSHSIAWKDILLWNVRWQSKDEYTRPSPRVGHPPFLSAAVLIVYTRYDGENNREKSYPKIARNLASRI